MVQIHTAQRGQCEVESLPLSGGIVADDEKGNDKVRCGDRLLPRREEAVLDTQGNQEFLDAGVRKSVGTSGVFSEQ